MDTRYPEPLSNIYKRATRKKVHRGNGARYKTQAVTFSEIREVDEENTEDGAERAGGSGTLQRSQSDNKLDRLNRLDDLDELLRLSELKLTRLEDTRIKNRIITDLIKTVHSLHPCDAGLISPNSPSPEPESEARDAKQAELRSHIPAGSPAAVPGRASEQSGT